ncbi:hypothetical protein LMH73_010250 [Vibrio splendidus]|nr:hypothetical protein [Vibrio splendidus]MCC4882964.1 hypothetical protein [Vibrio splendidus]
MSKDKLKPVEPFNVEEYLVLRDSPKYEQTYMITAYSEVSLGQWDVYGACHISAEYTNDITDMLIKAAGKAIEKEIAYIELASSTFDYFMEENAGSESLIITGDMIRYHMLDEENSGVFKSPNWKYLPKSFLLSFVETKHGDALYDTRIGLWNSQCENKKADFKADLMKHYGISESVFMFLVKDMQANMSSRQSLEAIVNHLESFNEALEEK